MMLQIGIVGSGGKLGSESILFAAKIRPGAIDDLAAFGRSPRSGRWGSFFLRRVVARPVGVRDLPVPVTFPFTIV